MPVITVTGQRPKLRKANGDFVAVAQDGFILGAPSALDSIFALDGAYLSCEWCDGEITSFATKGTNVRRVRVGDQHSFSVTEFMVPDGE